MEISFGTILLLIIIGFGVVGAVRGLRASALAMGAVFFAIAVVFVAGDTIVLGAQRLFGGPATTDARAVFLAIFFVLTYLLAGRVLLRVVMVPMSDLPLRERLFGALLNLVNGFLVVAMTEHYLAGALQAVPGSAKGFTVQFPALAFSHPSPNTWSVSLVNSNVTLLTPGTQGNYWPEFQPAVVIIVVVVMVLALLTLNLRLRRSDI